MLSTDTARRLVAWSLPVAAVLWVAGGLIDPRVDESTTTTYFAGLAGEAGATDRYQVSALVLHFAFLAFLPAILGLLTLLPRTRTRTVAGVLALMGVATMPGLLVTDYYDIALAQTLSPAQAAEVYDSASSLPGAVLLSLPAVVGLTVGLVTLFVAAWRERLVPAGAAAGLVVAFIAPIVVDSMTAFIAAGVIMLAAFTATSVRLLRAPAAAPAGA